MNALFWLKINSLAVSGSDIGKLFGQTFATAAKITTKERKRTAE
jgi:hypothetical protein